MAIASHLGPWLLGTQKTTGVVAGNNVYRNMGASTVGQTVAINAATSLTGTLGYIPAGAIITAAYMYTTSAFNGTPSVVVAVGGTTVTVNPGTYTSGVYNGALGLDQSVGAAAKLANVGTSDAAVTYTISGAGTSSGAATILVEYMVRNADGTVNPTYNQA